ncbi:hypothetical protein B0H67DRAFT_614339 [Lasiosphaeris hirsuta]|uniref:Uncharacterized protein n=1 Tax=Lasiosphaeris hirsuta TaxID=260670 RepID=A0AA40DF89_9PEZI|nr:hypothetical protein B0H67DRAFT_614339 [Lasiosphaeris hirsuta]
MFGEEVGERAIKSSRSLNTFWKSLIAAADAEVLLPKRQNPDNHWMTLKRPTNISGAIDKGPVTEISHWIYHEGAEMGLSTTPEYQKVEFTVTDIGLILKTLRLSADLISFLLPIQQVIFHALVLLFSLGFRQGIIMDIEGECLGAHHKREVPVHQHSPPYPLFCLTHLICVIGIHFYAFKAGYTSIDDFLHRPNLEIVEYIHLEWRDNMLGKKTFNMSYTNFCRTLRRAPSRGWLPHAGSHLRVPPRRARRVRRLFDAGGP